MKKWIGPGRQRFQTRMILRVTYLYHLSEWCTTSSLNNIRVNPIVVLPTRCVLPRSSNSSVSSIVQPRANSTPNLVQVHKPRAYHSSLYDHLSSNALLAIERPPSSTVNPSTRSRTSQITCKEGGRMACASGAGI